MSTTDTPRRVRKGLKFRNPYADGNPEWTVMRSRGRDSGAWDCKIVDDLDSQGTVKVFDSQEILAAIRWAAASHVMERDHDAFYAGLTSGQVVHYHDGFGQFIRCEAVPDGNSHTLLPVALVGKWREHDYRPHVTRTGDVTYSHHVKCIREGKTFTPHFSNNYEASEHLQRSQMDPRDLETLDISPPKPDPKNADAQAAWRLLETIGSTIQAGYSQDDAGPTLARVRALLDASKV